MRMIPKNGNRFSDKIMRNEKTRMIPKSGNRFSDKIMLKEKMGFGPNGKMNYGT
jgi:hypothetical protein